MSNDDGPKGGISDRPKLTIINGGRSRNGSEDHSNVYNIFPDSEVEILDTDIEFQNQHISRINGFFRQYSLDEVTVSQDIEGKPVVVLLKMKSEKSDQGSREDFSLLISPEQVDVIFQIRLGRLLKDKDKPQIVSEANNDTDESNAPSIEMVIEKLKSAVQLRPEFVKLGFFEINRGSSDVGPYYEYQLRKHIDPQRNLHFTLEDDILPLLEHVMKILGFEFHISDEPA